MSGIAAVFFDLDDTLCQASDAWQKAEQETFDRFLLPRPDLTELDSRRVWESVQQDLFTKLDDGQISMTEVRDARFPRTLAQLGIDDLTLAEELNQYLSLRRLAHMKPATGALDVLARLSERFHLGIITNGASDLHNDSQFTVAKNLGLLPYIRTFVVSDAIGFRKPDIRIFRHALSAAHVRPSKAVFVGDSLSKDINGANRVGMTSVWYNSDEDLPVPATPYEQPDFVIRSLSQLVPLVNRLGEDA